MTRRSSIVISAIIALASVTVLVGLSGMLSADRRRDLDRYTSAINQQRRQAGQAAPRPDDARQQRRDTVFCVSGVGTFFTTLHDALDASVVDSDGRLEPAELRRLSGLATRAMRYVEQAHAGPALPQRLGRTRIVDEDGAPAWIPLSPATVECEGGEAIAVFRLDTRGPAKPAAPAQPPASGAKAK